MGTNAQSIGGPQNREIRGFLGRHVKTVKIFEIQKGRPAATGLSGQLLLLLLTARCCRGHLSVHRYRFLRAAVPKVHHQRLSSLHDHFPGFHLIPGLCSGPQLNRSCNFDAGAIVPIVVVVIFADELADSGRERRHVAVGARPPSGCRVVFVWDCKRHHLRRSAVVKHRAQPHLLVTGAAVVVAQSQCQGQKRRVDTGIRVTKGQLFRALAFLSDTFLRRTNGVGDRWRQRRELQPFLLVAVTPLPLLPLLLLPFLVSPHLVRALLCASSGLMITSGTVSKRTERPSPSVDIVADRDDVDSELKFAKEPGVRMLAVDDMMDTALCT